MIGSCYSNRTTKPIKGLLSSLPSMELDLSLCKKAYKHVGFITDYCIISSDLSLKEDEQRLQTVRELRSVQHSYMKTTPKEGEWTVEYLKTTVGGSSWSRSSNQLSLGSSWFTEVDQRKEKGIAGMHLPICRWGRTIGRRRSTSGVGVVEDWLLLGEVRASGRELFAKKRLVRSRQRGMWVFWVEDPTWLRFSFLFVFSLFF